MGVRVFQKASPWLWPLALMALIFFLSAQPNLSTHLGLIDLIGRKIAHLCEYALLCFLWWRPLTTRTGPKKAVVLALVICVVYAISDEYHQSFVPGRSSEPSDVGIDSAGAFLAALLIIRHARHTAHRVASS
jgi:VanZ family protein